jgi:hypothetical protein
VRLDNVSQLPGKAARAGVHPRLAVGQERVEQQRDAVEKLQLRPVAQRIRAEPLVSAARMWVALPGRQPLSVEQARQIVMTTRKTAKRTPPRMH